MGITPVGTTDVICKKEDGGFVKLKTLKVSGDTSNCEEISFDGKKYFKQKVKSNDEEKTIFVSMDESDEREVNASELKSNDKKAKQQCGWDRAVDQLFDGFEKDFVGININSDTNDGDNNGSIGIGEASKHAVRGAILNPARAIAKHPVWSALGIGAAVVIGAFFPPVGVALMYGGLALGTVTAGVGIYQAKTAETDAQARNAWENIGSGVTTAVMSAIGIKHANQAASAANATSNATTAAPAATTTSATPKALRADAITKITQIKTAVKNGTLPPDVAKSQILDVLKGYHLQDPSAHVAKAALKVINPEAVTATTATSTKSALELADEQSIEFLKKPIEYAKKPVKATVETCKKVRPKVFKETYCKGQKSDFHKGIEPLRNLRAKITPASTKAGQGLQNVQALCTEAKTYLSKGNQYQAERALINVGKIIKGGTFAEGELAQAKELLKQTEALAKTMHYLNKPPMAKIGLLGEGYFANMLDNSALEEADFGNQYATLVED